MTLLASPLCPSYSPQDLASEGPQILVPQRALYKRNGGLGRITP